MRYCEDGFDELWFTADAILDTLMERLRGRGVRSLIDLKCGRGQLARWLHIHASQIRYTGVDQSGTAIFYGSLLSPHVPFVKADYRTQGQFDAAVMIGSFAEAAFDANAAAAIVQMLTGGGTFFAGVQMLSQAEARAFPESIESFREAGCDVVYEDWTHRVEPQVLALASGWNQFESRPPQRIWRKRFEGLARKALDAIREGCFAYAVLDVRKMS